MMMPADRDRVQVRRALECVLGLGLLVLLVGCGRPPQPRTRASAAPSDTDPVWHYEGEEGPEHWADLTPAFAACREGTMQSPIDIPLPVPSDMTPALSLQFPPAALRIAHHEHVADGINNGHTIQINYDDGDTLALGDAAYELVQYHFHHPSEHTLSGRRFPMEMHMVHRAASGGLAVVAVLIDEGRHNAAFDPVWNNLPRTKGVETHYEHVTVDVDALLPAVHTSYRYDGSLTTPPCTEGVKWFVLTTPIELDVAQVHAFGDLIGENSRPVQPVNGRAIVADVVH
jgi:carbonic anhydrase